MVEIKNLYVIIASQCDPVDIKLHLERQGFFLSRIIVWSWASSISEYGSYDWLNMVCCYQCLGLGTKVIIQYQARFNHTKIGILKTFDFNGHKCP